MHLPKYIENKQDEFNLNDAKEYKVLMKSGFLGITDGKEPFDNQEM